MEVPSISELLPSRDEAPEPESEPNPELDDDTYSELGNDNFDDVLIGTDTDIDADIDFGKLDQVEVPYETETDAEPEPLPKVEMEKPLKVSAPPPAAVEDEVPLNMNRVPVALEEFSKDPVGRKEAERFFGGFPDDSLKYPSLYAGYPHTGFINVFYACQENPLRIWEKQVWTMYICTHETQVQIRVHESKY
jgi:hypothetical protein